MVILLGIWVVVMVFSVAFGMIDIDREIY